MDSPPLVMLPTAKHLMQSVAFQILLKRKGTLQSVREARHAGKSSPETSTNKTQNPNSRVLSHVRGCNFGKIINSIERDSSRVRQCQLLKKCVWKNCQDSKCQRHMCDREKSNGFFDVTKFLLDD